jgi:drug/metabolite transporter (DMT)-like permease
MGKAVLLAVIASLCTATSSVCQRLGARDAATSDRFDIWLIFRLVRRPIWLLGIGSMILGFAFQVTALRYGPLALVQPLLALELIFVFGYMAFIGSRRVQRRDWLAAVAMSAGLCLFLLVASPAGGQQHAPARLWWIAGLGTLAAVVAALAVTSGLGRKSPPSPARRAAVLGATTGTAWGFVAAVIKEFSSHLGQGIGAIVSNWSPYVLICVGAATLLLASQALAAGPLAASQPGFTILDPLVATLLGIFLFSEHIQNSLPHLLGEVAGLALLAAGVSVLSHSHLIVGEHSTSSGAQAAAEAQSPGTRTRRLPRAVPPGPEPWR